MSIDKLSVTESEVNADNQLQVALPVNQASANNSFVPSSSWVEQRLNGYQTQPNYAGVQPVNQTNSNMYDEYNYTQVSPTANNQRKTGFVQGVKNFLAWQ